MHATAPAPAVTAVHAIPARMAPPIATTSMIVSLFSLGRVSQIEQGKISGQEVVARYAAALGGRLHQAIYFDDGNIAAIA